MRCGSPSTRSGRIGVDTDGRCAAARKFKERCTMPALGSGPHHHQQTTRPPARPPCSLGVAVDAREICSLLPRAKFYNRTRPRSAGRGLVANDRWLPRSRSTGGARAHHSAWQWPPGGCATRVLVWTPRTPAWTRSCFPCMSRAAWDRLGDAAAVAAARAERCAWALADARLLRTGLCGAGAGAAARTTARGAAVDVCAKHTGGTRLYE